MKLTDLQEAPKHGPKMAQLVTAAKELGIPLKLQKWDYYEEDLNHYLHVLKSAAGNDRFATSMAVSVPLNSLVDGLNKLQDAALKDVFNALSKLRGTGFMDEKTLGNYIDGAAKASGLKEDLLGWAKRLQSVMRLVAKVRYVAGHDKDDYRRAVAVAVMKNLGVEV